MNAGSLRVLAIALLLVGSRGAAVSSSEGAGSLPAVEPGSVLLASAEGVSVFSRDGEMKFGRFSPSPVAFDDMVYDAWRLPSGNFLYSSHRYVRESSPAGQTQWEYRLPAPSELKSCVPLPNGDVMTVDAERMELVQVTDQGRREARRIPVPTRKDAAPHNRYNLLRRTPANTFLLALRHEKAFVEVDESGKELWRHSVPDLPVVAERLAGGNTLMSWRSGILEVAPDHRVVWELKASDITEFPVVIFGGFHRFADGNTLIANSDWHYPEAGKNRVQLFEVTPDKKVVWQLTTDAFAGRKPGSLEPRSGLVEHRITGLQWLGGGHDAARPDDVFFQSVVQPILVERCYECHSHQKKIKGGLALDSRSGWEKGGEGGPAVVPGAPDKSRLIAAVRYSDADLQMPPKKRLSDAEVAGLVDWVRRGAPDPRPALGSGAHAENARKEWERLYLDRMAWWSLRPIDRPGLPRVKEASWPLNPVDAFILAALEAQGLKPVAEADRRTLARRLSFALTGLPLGQDEVEKFARNDAPGAYDDLVRALLDRPSFGEHWARHWMDLVHYTDTHGYEWDVPAKNAWMYRDYLVRAFNGDLSFQRFALEQIAGDFLEPRVDPATGLNESLIGPMSMRLGERRHGDNSEIEGITQEAIGNMIDTTSKAWIATTVACAQCHDHKLDAVGQSDYYGLAGILMSTRWHARIADAADPNAAVLEDLKRLKSGVREPLSQLWLASKAAVMRNLLASTADPKAPARAGFPAALPALWRRLMNAGPQEGALEAAWKLLGEEFRRDHQNGIAANRANLSLWADFTQEELPPGWKADGFGMKHGLVRDGEIAIGDEGGDPIRLLPAGRWSHAWSMRLEGALRSPLFDPLEPATFSVGTAGGRHSAYALIVDHALFSERMTFLQQPEPGWLTLTSGGFNRISGGIDRMPRRTYLEFVTKTLNNNFPPRTGFGGLNESEVKDERSWFGVTRLYRHAPGKAPQDELSRFAPLFAEGAAPSGKEEAAGRLADLLMAAVERWSREACDAEDVRLLNDALHAKWLPLDSPALSGALALYRAAEKRLRPGRVVGSAAEWNEGRDERIGIRGSYTDFGDLVPRGNIRFLGGAATRALPSSSGRLEWARSIASEQNPLTVRVYVNRVWHYLFGEGLVRTVDDFGHLGEKPSHPELLDWLATRFMAEGWSTKKLVTLLVTSATWRQSSVPAAPALLRDPENRLWHHHPMRRLDAEAIRDSLLAVSGRLDPSLGGPPVDPFRASEDAAKRLRRGPLDGDGRRSLYLKMTLMEPPKFLALFNQPIPKLTVGRRDATSVPDQALALLNDPFVIAMAKHWSERVLKDRAETPEARVRQMFSRAFGRPPGDAEVAGLVKLARRSAELRGSDPAALMTNALAWQDVAHALFNLKEFIYVR
jgi:hypothetical protein